MIGNAAKLWVLNFLHDQNTIKNNNFTSSPGMIPVAASKQAPEIRACFRNSGLGASPSLPFGSDPITLKYRKIMTEKSVVRA
jgi:hypothetical protein